MKQKAAKERMDNFQARSSKCPLCKKQFKSGQCPHNVREARDRLFEDYIKSLSK